VKNNKTANLLKTTVLLSLMLLQAAYAAEPSLVFACPLKPDPPPVIDGDIREWERLPAFEVEEKNVTWGKANWEGEEDLSGSFKVCYDSNYFYLLAEVVDEKITIAGGKGMFRCDHVEMTFVPRYEENAKGPIESDWRIIAFSPGTQQPTGDIFSDLSAEAYFAAPSETDSSSVDVASMPREDGYLIEARIPWKLLGVTKRPEIGDVFGFDLHLSDSDSGLDQETLTSLNPTKWRGRQKENILKLVLTGTDGIIK